MVNKFMGYMPRRREFSEEESFQIVEVDIPSPKKKIWYMYSGKAIKMKSHLVVAP